MATARKKAKKKPAARKRGRPSLYTRALSDQICARLSQGETLNQICKAPEFPVARPTIISWVNDDVDGFADRYARARALLLEHWAEEVVSISDDGSNDYMEREVAQGVFTEVVDQEHIQRSRLRVDTRKWLLSKLAPQQYGERLQVEHETGPNLADAMREARDRSKTMRESK